jgi:mono/diheme cytochrome c family protein
MPGATAGSTGQPVSIALNAGSFVVQIREPAAIVVIDSSGTIDQTISLNAVSRLDTGHFIFSHNASATSFLACESCHAEGHDDGHVWLFDTTGLRRTQNIEGGVLDTLPLHWDGSMTDVGDIMTNVFVNRMGGAPQGPRHVAAVGDWLNSIARYPASPTGTQAQITHGQQIFESSEAGCIGCHNGEHFTNNQNADVGTGNPGETFQVPGLLGVAGRAPYMHDGCAATLNDRFDPTQATCNGGESHGHTAQLAASDVNDLISYLETL